MSQKSEVNDQPILEEVANNTRARLSCYLAIQVKHENKQLTTEIVTACRQQLDACLWLIGRTTTPDDIETGACNGDWLEALEKMVVYETEAFYLLEKLLTRPLSPQTRDILYRMQATIYHHHLPALRREISTIQAADPTALLEEIKSMVREKDPVEWARFFCGPRGVLAGGALLGAGALWLLKDQINLNTKE